MNEEQVFQTAQQMFLLGKGRKEVIDFMLQNNIPADQVDAKATQAYLAIKDQRQELIQEAHPENVPPGGGGLPSIVLGMVMILGGVIASMNTDRIFYGLIIVGIITFFGGIIRR